MAWALLCGTFQPGDGEVLMSPLMEQAETPGAGRACGKTRCLGGPSDGAAALSAQLHSSVGLVFELLRSLLPLPASKEVGPMDREG